MILEPTDWLLLVWLLALGGTVGSFLNVVVYRLPAGKSLVSPPSHCPACNTPIRWHDNVPIFGWIWLRGRCRDCGVRISPRYPIVEAATAGLFVLLGLLEPIAGGVNLPTRPVEVGDGLLLPAWSPLSVELFGIYAFHLLLCCTLLAAGLIAWDGNRVPGRLYLPALIVGVSAPLAWPWLHPVAAAGPLEGWVAGLVDAVAGPAAGGLAGWLASRPLPRQHRSGLWLAAVSAGAVLGWQAGLLLGVFAILTGWLGRHADEAGNCVLGISPVGWLAAASLAWIVAWSHIAAWLPRVG